MCHLLDDASKWDLAVFPDTISQVKVETTWQHCLPFIFASSFSHRESSAFSHTEINTLKYVFLKRARINLPSLFIFEGLKKFEKRWK